MSGWMDGGAARRGNVQEAPTTERDIEVPEIDCKAMEVRKLNNRLCGFGAYIDECGERNLIA